MFSIYCWSVILIDSAFTRGKSYQAFLEECKYVVKEKKMPEYIADGTEDSDEENSNE